MWLSFFAQYLFQFAGHDTPCASTRLVRNRLPVPLLRECSLDGIGNAIHSLINDDSEFLRMKNFWDAAYTSGHNGRATRQGFGDHVWPAFARASEKAYLCCIEPLRQFIVRAFARQAHSILKIEFAD